MHDTFTLEKENERLTARVAELEEDLEQHSENWRVKAGHLEQERDRLREALKLVWSMFEDQRIVRNIQNDGKPDWALKMLEFTRDLQRINAVLHPTEPAPEANDA